jgi:hypothetical protein
MVTGALFPLSSVAPSHRTEARLALDLTVRVVCCFWCVPCKIIEVKVSKSKRIFSETRSFHFITCAHCYSTFMISQGGHGDIIDNLQTTHTKLTFKQHLQVWNLLHFSSRVLWVQTNLVCSHRRHIRIPHDLSFRSTDYLSKLISRMFDQTFLASVIA